MSSAGDPDRTQGEAAGLGSSQYPEPSSESLEQQFERLLADAETTVAKLRRELDGARSRQLTEREILEQHAEIDELRDHLAAAQLHWGEVREFFEAALRQLVEPRSEEQD